jgi:hypothetical protein
MPLITVDTSAFSGILGGAKTYISAAVGIVGNALAVFHVVTLTPDQLLSLNAIAGMVVAVFMRMGIKKAQTAAEANLPRPVTMSALKPPLAPLPTSTPGASIP